MQALVPGTYLKLESGGCYKIIELFEDVISLKSTQGDTVIAYKIDHLKRLLSHDPSNQSDDTKLV